MQTRDSKNDFNDNELWDLLGKGQTAKPGSNFTDRVMQEIRRSEEVKNTPSFAAVFNWLSDIFHSAAPARFAVAACVILAATSLVLLNDPLENRHLASAKNKIALPTNSNGETTYSFNTDLDIILDLDNLLAMEEHYQWR
ncbi:MAG: hypothetical protein ACK5NG_12020 [Chthoniobacterales bacterium]